MVLRVILALSQFHEDLQEHAIMPGIFIISFDCEGKWGINEYLNSHHDHFFTNERINHAYQGILNSLNNAEIKGTFAFVGAFTMSLEEYRANCDWFSDVSILGQNWFSGFNQSIKENKLDGWLNPSPYEMVIKEKSHELASHGFSHLPLQEGLINESTFLREMELIKLVSRIKGIEPKTFIYPRNLTGYTEQLGKAGFIGYRNGTEQYPNLIQRLKNLLGEFNIFDRAQEQPAGNQSTIPVCLPSGHFLNWRWSLRKNVPISISIKKYSHMINDAIQNNRILHLWSHPHNFVDGDRMHHLLDKVLEQVGSAVKRGDLINYTQEEYIEYISKTK